MKLVFCLILFLITLFSPFFAEAALAIVPPLDYPNNKFGIHIISATESEVVPATQMVNKNGDWGYITVLIEDKDRKKEKWQAFFDLLRRNHLIPIVRVATHPEGNNWARPTENDENSLADFLNDLNWPVKNRYVIFYNEPNHATEWGGTVDPGHYTRVLSKSIDVLKAKNPDFFVLNAGLDASAPQKMPAYMDELEFLKHMAATEPDIFNKLDGWVSHSYPNPGFIGSPDDTGRTSIRGFEWELQVLKSLGLKKDLPIFITETGWKHSEGKDYNNAYPSPERVAEFYQKAFENAWKNLKIVAVTPFLLTYQDAPFDHFSFKKYTGEGQQQKILGLQYPDYHPQYERVANILKTKGSPLQENKAQLIKGEIYHSLVTNQYYQIPLTFKNSGQSIWNDGNSVKLRFEGDIKALGLSDITIPEIKKVEPGGEHTFTVNIKAPNSGTYALKANLFLNDKKFDMEDFSFSTEIKSPVLLKIKSGLKWKNNFSGNYILGVSGAIGKTINNIVLDKTGQSGQLEANYLLPDYTFEFTLEKPFYKPKTIQQKLNSGLNELDFGQLEPDIGSAILNPIMLWKLLPLSE